MKNKTIAALLAFFLGGLGIHKFYLGQGGMGALYLIFSWTFIPALVSIFEFIGLLLMSDNAFNNKFNRPYQQTVVIQQGSPVQEPSKDKTQALSDVKNLYDAGIITAEEYEEKRRKLLDAI